MSPLERRVAAVERLPGRWQVWLDLPVSGWPDAALRAFLATQPAEVQAALRAMTVEQIREVANDHNG